MSDKSYSSKLAPSTPLFIGLDLGTTGARAIAINVTGAITAQSFYHYDTHHHRQTPQDWWQATQTLLKDITTQINNHHIQSIAVAGTSSTVLLCDAQGHPISPTLMYNEQHAKPQAEFLKSVAPKNSVVLSATSGLAKVLWLLEHHKPEVPFHIVHQADWVAGQLSQRFGYSDINNSLKTGFDAVNKVWPLWLTDLFLQLNINKNCLPTVLEPGSFVSNIHPHIASDIGLPLDTEIIIGTTDSTAAFISSGANQVGQAVTSLGSTLVLKVISNNPINDSKYGVYSQPYGKHWLVGGASNSGGAVLKYYFSDKQIATLTEELKPQQYTNLNYYPLIEIGERFPINDPDLSPRLTPKVDNDALFFQGILEGIAAIEHKGYKLLEQLGAPYPSSVLTMGGGAINTSWQTIREHKLGLPVTVATRTEAAYGSALLAAKNYI